MPASVYELGRRLLSSTSQAPLPVPPAAPLKSTRRWPLIPIFGAVFAAIGITFAATRLWHTQAKRDIQLYSVAPCSFPVILEEKGELKAANSIEIRSELEGKSTIINL